MRSIVVRVLVALVLGASAADAAVPPPVAPIDYRERTLANGLRVFAIPDKSTANVAVQVWYDVGAKDDPTGRSGFAHMFEHLMFKSTRNLVPEQFERLTEDVGGFNNASTDDDYTNYYEVVPANHLEQLLWAEAERMGSLVVGAADLASERNVVEEELRQGQARPYGKMFQTYLPAISYTTHSYARSPIGRIADLDSATLDDIRAFHALYYRPDNAVLVVAGNFDAAQLDRWVDKYFAGLARPDRPIPRVTVTEPPRTAPRRVTVYEDNTPLPAVVVSWLIPPSRSADDAPLEVLEGVMSAGESSRLYQTMVYRDQLATAAGANMNDKQGTGVFAVYAIMAGGKSVADGEAALRRETKRLRDAPVSAAELDSVKNQLLTGAIQGRETASGKASALAQAVIVDGDPKAADRQIAAVAAVTAADVQRVARKYLTDDRSVTLDYLPKEAELKGRTSGSIDVAATVRTAPLVVPAGLAVVTPAPADQRVQPPPPGAPIAVPVPAVSEHRLPNGLRVAVATQRDVPLISVALVAAGGAAADAPGRDGTASLASTLLTKGTPTRSATEIAEQIEALGGALGGGAGWDGTSLSLTIKSDRVQPAMDIFADVALHPVFAPAELERARTQAIDAAGIALKNPSSLARLVTARAVFGGTPYGHVAGGTLASLARISRDDVAGAYRAAWRPDTATLIVAGDIDDAGAMALATRLFGGWQSPATAAVRPVTAADPAPRTIVVDLPGAAQASVVVARPGLARGDPRYYPAIVANTALGGGFASRLNKEIRVKRGLAYGASSNVDARRGVGPLTAATATKNPSVPEVIGLMLAELRRIGTEPIPAAELTTKKAALNGDFGRDVETGSGLVSRLAGLAFDGMPLGELGRFSGSVEAVTPAAITALGGLFDPSPASIVIVGDAKQFLPGLAKAGIRAEVIPSAALDLDVASLRR